MRNIKNLITEAPKKDSSKLKRNLVTPGVMDTDESSHKYIKNEMKLEDQSNMSATPAIRQNKFGF
jgi:hypothetical protein